MQPDPPSSPSQYILRIVGREPAQPTLLEITNFLYDVNLVYELAALATDERYQAFKFDHNALRRNGRPLSKEARLRVLKLSHESPIEIVLVVAIGAGTLPALLTMLKVIEKAYNMAVDHRIRLAAAEKAERDNRTAAREEEKQIKQADAEAKLVVEQSPASALLEQTSKRLGRGPVKAAHIEIDFISVDTVYGSNQ